MSEPRKDRWFRLHHLGERLAKNDPKIGDLSRRARRQLAYRVLREAEEFHGEKLHKRWRGRIYVNANALDRLALPENQMLSTLEQNVADLSAKTKHLVRQGNDHGARIRNLEKWRELTRQYIADVAELEGNESDSKATRRVG